MEGLLRSKDAPVVSDWESIQKFLETPWLGNVLTMGQILWGLLGGLLAGLAWFYKNVLKAMYARLAGWARGLPTKIYARLGLVTQAEHLQTETRLQAELLKRDDRIAGLEKEIQSLKAAQQKSTSASALPPPVAAPPPAGGWTGPKTIERFGVKFDLVDPIGNYLGKFNPPAVPDNVIKTFLHGPFCRNCNYSLTEGEVVGLIMQDVVVVKCPMCTHTWRKDKVLASDLLRRVYNALDGEFRSNKKIAETDVKEGTLLEFFLPLPKKPW